MSLVSSVRWVAVAQAARIASQLVSITVLARMLPSESYGLMAMAMTVTNLVFLFRDLGTSAAIIQRAALGSDMQSTVYWTNVALGISVAVVLALAAKPVAAAFGEPRLYAMIIALAIVFPISSLGLVHQALLERTQQFRVLARIETISAFGGLTLAIVLAVNGAEVWSLVMQMVFAAALTTVQLMLASDWKPRRIFVMKDLREILGFGGNLSLFRLVIYLEQNADSIIIGKALGSAALGVYAMAYKVMLFPIQNLTGVVSRALFPALCRRQESPEALGSIYLRSVGAVCIVTAPLMAGVFFLREEFVALVFGPNWKAIPDILKWLAPVGFIQSITVGTGVVFMALGKSRMLLMLGILGSILQVGSFLIGVRWGIEGVAKSYFVANLINLFPCFCCAAWLLRIPILRAFSQIGKPVIASSLMLLVLLEAQNLMAGLALPLPVSFVVQVAVGAAAYAFALLVLLQQDVSDIRSLVRFS